MVRINGKAVSDGIAIGKIMFLSKDKISAKPEHISDIQAEIQRYKSASDRAIKELSVLSQVANQRVGKDGAEIFEIHQMMLCDKDFVACVEGLITDGQWSAEYAVEQTAKIFSDSFLAMDNDYMRGRASDILDVAERMIKILTNKTNDSYSISPDEEKVIICADDLSPSETVQLDKSKVVAFATRYGSSQSHTAILAATMNIPAIIGLGEELSDAYNGMLAIVDGSDGSMYIDPTQNALQIAQERHKQAIENYEKLLRLKGMENRTLDGHEIMVYSNIGTPDDVKSVLDNDAGGIGLFRSEFLYLGAENFPSEEEQFNAYKKVLCDMNGKRVIIRTLDIGADKCIDYFGLEAEQNPALGYRAIRICLSRREIFRTQLRALLRASTFGTLSIMLPMIISVDEVRQAKELINEVKAELRKEKIEFRDDIELGVMIETPASVMISELLAKEVDFFSIGTNDLTQYTLAIDRQNRNLEPYYDPHHLSVLRMIHHTIRSAHNANIWCGICGELASDLTMTESFLAMGIDELSVAPPYVLPLREKIRSVNVGAIREACLAKL